MPNARVLPRADLLCLTKYVISGSDASSDLDLGVPKKFQRACSTDAYSRKADSIPAQPFITKWKVKQVLFRKI
eukprot:6174082-Pleurochrysis_carterae.AAC.2